MPEQQLSGTIRGWRCLRRKDSAVATPQRSWVRRRVRNLPEHSRQNTQKGRPSTSIPTLQYFANKPCGGLLPLCLGYLYKIIRQMSKVFLTIQTTRRKPALGRNAPVWYTGASWVPSGWKTHADQRNRGTKPHRRQQRRTDRRDDGTDGRNGPEPTWETIAEHAPYVRPDAPNDGEGL